MDLISIDESGNNLHVTPPYGYDKIGSGTIKIPKPGKGENITILCGISRHFGVLSY